MRNAICVLFLSVALSAQSSTPPKPRDRAPCAALVPEAACDVTALRVPDEITALKIAEPALIKTYGKRRIDNERPLAATLDLWGIWTVSGTQCCKDRNGHRNCELRICYGGVAVLKLRQSDGKILSIEHFK